MSARGKTLVPLLVVVVAVEVALQSTSSHVEPVDPEKPGELLLRVLLGDWGQCQAVMGK